jgi:hypothetical protein
VLLQTLRTRDFDELVGSEDKAVLLLLTQAMARLSKAGHARLRKALYLPTLTAIRFNPLLGGFIDRLVAAGKSRMAAVGACLRKLLMIAWTDSIRAVSRKMRNGD